MYSSGQETNEVYRHTGVTVQAIGRPAKWLRLYRVDLLAVKHVFT